MYLQAALLYNAIAMVSFGMVALLIFPMHVQKLTGFKAVLNTRQVLMYRIAGVWVVFAGVVSWRVLYLTDALQRELCWLLILAHAVELVVKLLIEWDIFVNPIMDWMSKFSNAHLIVILLVGVLL
eukprot:gnl/TRDRNA2_/TRDRNA2_196384_c0_seq1.p1 gnl/TRDRNA2_/TRDRNA2_196384_c0~~gnl/TRDRNA2_/TRDRNA2_196384_c0_seq1.p1  ORF type:complete len:125 (+),score=13.13 gnl/TRDRNA2_/TRDRNA2_196384_c0_seq1:63-437(+)